MEISIVTDEISADPETAFELGAQWGIRAFELRSFGTNRVPLYTPYQKARIRALVEEYQAKIVGISPGLFKFPFPSKEHTFFPVRAIDYGIYSTWRNSQEVLKYHLGELLPLSIEYAHELGTNTIVIFSFARRQEPQGSSPPDEMLEVLQQAAEQAGKAGLRLAIEVEEGFWADTGEHTARIIETIDHSALGVNWDPGNALPAGDKPYPNGYEAVRNYVCHVHFKDVARTSKGSYEYVVQGDIDWDGQIQALIADGYDGHISVETHMYPKVRYAKAVTERLQQLLTDVTLERKGNVLNQKE